MRNEELFKEKPVWSAILTLAIPSVLSVLVMLLYNMADMFFVGLLHDNVQVAAVSVVGPIFSLVTAAATMVGVGGCAAIAKAAGAGEMDQAKTCASLCGWFCILFGSAAALFFIGFTDPLLHMLGATPEMMSHSAVYLRVLAVGVPFMLFGTGFASLLRAEGAVQIGFLGNLAGTALNLLLDPVLIFGLGMGVTGAAAATVLGNLLSTAIYLWYVFRRSSILTLHPRFASQNPQALLHIFALGLPNAVSGILSGLASTFSNRLLNPYGTEALAAMGAAGKVTMLITLVQMGVQPLMAYNYGAHNLSRLKEILQKVAALTVCLGAVSTVICCLARRGLIRVFLRDEIAAAMGEQMVVWLLLAGPLYYLSSNFLQASGNAAAATLVSILRQGVILIPSLYVMSAWQGFTGIAVAHAVADALASVLALILCLRQFRRIAMQNVSCVDGIRRVI
jgi:putative MATE family efflux protein